MATIVGSGQVQHVSRGSTTSDTQVEPGGEQVVENGGVANYTSVFGVDEQVGGTVEYVIGVQVVNFGGIAAGTYLSNGEQDVYGLAVNALVKAGSHQYVLAGGLAEYGTLQDGLQTVSSGGESYQDSVWDTQQDVYGLAKQDTLLLDTSEIVHAGGSALGSIVSGGNIFVQSGGLISGTDVIEGNNGQAIIVSAGGSALATTLSAFDQTVSSGGYVSGTVMLSGATQYNDGYEDGTSIHFDAADEIGADGYAQHTVISSGGSQTVEGQSYQATVSIGGVLEVESSTFGTPHWAFANDVAVYGLEKLDAGGEDYFGYIYGSQAVSSGGEASGSTIVGGYEEVQSGGYASGVAVYSGGQQHIEAGGSAASSYIASGSFLLVGGSAAAVTADGTVSLVSGGTITGITLSAHGRTNILGGVESNATILGGAEYVYSGGDSQDATLSGGFQYVDGGQTEQTNVLSGGVQYVSSGGVANYSLVYQGGRMVIRARGLTALSEIGSGGTLVVSRAGSAYETFDDAGATVQVLSGGRETYGEIDGRLIAASGAVIAHDIVDSGGVDVMQAGAAESRVTILRGGVLELVKPSVDVDVVGRVTSAVTISGVTLRAGAILDTQSQTVSSGRQQTVSAGGEAFFASVASGGEERVLWGGAVFDMQVASGGLVSGGGVLSGRIDDYGHVFGTAAGLTVASGGQLIVHAGAQARNVAVGLGGTLVVDGLVAFTAPFTLAGTRGGNGQIEKTGAGLLVLSGNAGGFTGRTLIEGGAVEATTGAALGDGAMVYAAASGVSATLQLDAAAEPANGATLANALSNFQYASDVLDLHGQAYVAGATATVVSNGGTVSLKVVDGGYTASFVLSGAHAATYAVSADGNGDVEIVASDAVANSVLAMTQGMAAFADPARVDAVRPVSAMEPSSGIMAGGGHGRGC